MLCSESEPLTSRLQRTEHDYKSQTLAESTQTEPEHLPLRATGRARTRRRITIFPRQYIFPNTFVFEYSVKNLSDRRMFSVERIWVHGRVVRSPRLVFRYYQFTLQRTLSGGRFANLEVKINDSRYLD